MVRRKGKAHAIPLHGYVKDTAFDIAAQGEDFVTLTTKATQETLAIYPYDFAFSLLMNQLYRALS